MGRIFILFIICLFIASCAAFSNETQTVSAEVANPSVGENGEPMNMYAGFYSGELTSESNTCQADVLVEGPLSMDVVQTGDVMSALFEDGTEGRGTLTGNNVVILMEAKGVSKLYNLSFNEEGSEGSLEVIETKNPDGQLGDPCATSSITLTKGEKPEGWGVVAASAEEGSEESEAKK